ALAAHAAARMARRAGAGKRIIVCIGAVEVSAAAVDVDDEEVEAVEGVQLEVAEHFVEQREVEVDSAAVIFEARFEGVVDLRLELEIRAGGDDSLAAGLSRNDANRAAAGQRW